MSKLNLSAIVELNGEEKDLYKMDQKDREEIGKLLTEKFLESMGCKVKKTNNI